MYNIKIFNSNGLYKVARDTQLTLPWPESTITYEKYTYIAYII